MVTVRMYGTPQKARKLFAFGLILALALNPLAAAQETEPSCLSSSHKSILGKLAEDEQNISQSDLESIFNSLCTRDQTYHNIQQEEIDEFKESQKDYINNTLDEEKKNLKDFVDSRLVSQNELAKQLEGLDTVINNTMRRGTRVSKLESRVNDLEKKPYVQKSYIDENFVPNQEFNATKQSLENRISGQAVKSSSPMPDIPPLYLFLGFCAIIGGVVLADSKDMWIFEDYSIIGADAKDLSQQDLQKMGLENENSNQKENEKPKSYGKMKDERNSENNKEDIEETLDKREIELKNRKEELREKISKYEERDKRTLTDEETKELEDWKDELVEIELGMGV